MFSDTEDSDDTDSEISIALHSQDEDDLSAEDTPLRVFHILLTPPRTHNEMLPRPSTPNIQPPAQETEPAVIPANTQPQPT